MGSIVDDLRLPPDPKIGGNKSAYMPDFTLNERAALRDMAIGLMARAAKNAAWSRCVFPDMLDDAGEKLRGISRSQRWALLLPALEKLAKT